jgi:NADH dehydrogenase FAD-containing subunit
VLQTDTFLRVLGVKDVFALGDCASVAQPQLLSRFVELFKEADVVRQNMSIKKFIIKGQDRHPHFGGIYCSCK